jgi:ABC-type molybdate transport system ATPase subunit
MFPELVSETFPDTGKSIHPNQPIQQAQGQQDVFEDLVEKLSLKHLLDLPLVALSNGQTRRARIVKVLLSKPELLLLDEPLSTSIHSLV